MDLRRVVAVLAVVALPGCSGAGADERTVVASLYPLAFAAERVAGPGWGVIDLTPPGTEAHDVELSLNDRAAIEDAAVVLYLGVPGFQPQVDGAVEDAGGRVVNLWGGGLPLRIGAEVDPHVWLDPARFAGIVDRIGSALSEPAAAARLRADLEALDARYRRTLDDCRSHSLVVSHAAFGYLASRYGLEQVGLAGLEPEGEPSVGALEAAAAVLSGSDAGAVFYEAGDEARRIAETVAGDAGVDALPLSTLESRPPSGDYLSVMEDNLESLRRGLGCR